MTIRLLAALGFLVPLLAAGSVAHAQTPPPPAPPPQAPAQPSPTPGQDPPLTVGRDRVMAPRLLSSAKPQYTAEAMRNRIQGSVRLRAIVERDGTPSGVEVVNSLDAKFGLDQAAIDAVKQWRFAPGTVDGNPVRVMVTVDLSFVLRDSTPAQGWPDGFSEVAASPQSVEEVVEAQQLRLTIRRPADWTIRRSGPPSEWVSVRSADGLESMMVLRPELVTADLHWPASDAQIQSVADLVRKLQPDTGLETIATGQVHTAAGAFWIWSAFRAPNLPNLGGTADAANARVEGRLWAFARTVNGRMVLVAAMVLLPRDADPAVIASRVQKAAAEFAPIINSVQVEAIAN
jgi:TonB family protein